MQTELRDWEIPRTRITLPGKAKGGEKPYFLVRGLCADDLTFLIAQHVGPITKALKLYQDSRADIMATGNLQGFIMTLSRDFPHIVSEVISAAADALDDETRAKAAKLPATVQLAAMSEIAKLTLEEVGGLKNLLAEMRERLGDVQGIASEISATARPKTN